MTTRRAHILLAAIIILLVCSIHSAIAQEDEYNHPELVWKSFETEHFHIYFTEGLEDVADLAAQIAEEIHEPLCKLYDYRPDQKVSLIFSDTDDIANAATYFQSNKIKFWATSMNWDFRGTHNWLRNVITHEYTHMIQLGATRKWTRQIPAAYVQFLGYEAERRPDVLYGYPNRLISWPLPSITVPAWFAEGTAQYQFSGSGYDFWDSHRDMLLRQATLANRLLSFEDMGYFGKTSLGSEEVYNQGFALTKYIADKSSDPKVLERISHELSGVFPTTMDRATKKATGRSGEEWYDEWKASLESHYGHLRDSLAPSLTHADTIPVKGYVNLYPRLSPDGKRVAFISNQNRDYFGQSSLYLYDLESKKSEILTGGVQGGISWMPDGSGIIYAHRDIRPPHGSSQYDLYVYLFEGKRTVRLTDGLRAESVDISPDGKTLVLTMNEQGRRAIALAKMPAISKRIKPVTKDSLLYRHPSAPYEQYYLPRWSPDGKRIAVTQHLYEGRSIRIFEVDASGRGLTLLKEFSGENVELRDPSWSEDGNSLLVSWDVSGISNIYRLDIESGSREQLTSVLGGAFYPEMRTNKLVYSDFCAQGFRVCLLSNPETIKARHSALDDVESKQSNYLARVPKPNFSLTAQKNKATNYRPNFEKICWFPRLAFDYGTFKPGAYVLLNDVLDKLTFIGGFAINEKKDYDLFGSVEYRAFYPTIFAEYYNIQRRLTSHFADSSRIIREDPGFTPVYDTYRIRYRYNLDELDAGVRVPLGDGNHIKATAVWDRYTANNRFDEGTSIAIVYFKGWAAKLGIFADHRRPGVVSSISPSGGYKAYAEFTRANHLFFTDLKIGGDVLGLEEIYAPYNYNMIEGGYEKYFSLPGWQHTLELRARGGYIGKRVDPFFFLYAGGLPGMRGYSFYSLGGERTAVGTLTYRFPITKHAALNLWPISVNQVYGQVFSDVGDAWGYLDKFDNVKKDIGAGLRFQMHSFYSYPTALSFDVAYGLDRFMHTEDDVSTQYGRELRYYLTLLFDFYSPFSGGGSGLGRTGF